MKKIVYVGGTVLVAMLTVLLVRIHSPIWWIVAVGYVALLVGRALYWIASRANRARDLADATISSRGSIRASGGSSGEIMFEDTEIAPGVQIGAVLGDSNNPLAKETWSLFTSLTAQQQTELLERLDTLLTNLGSQANVDDKLTAIQSIRDMIVGQQRTRSSRGPLDVGIGGDAKPSTERDNPYYAQKRPRR